MRHEFHSNFRVFDNTCYILVPTRTAAYLAKKELGKGIPVQHLHGEPVKVEVEL